MDRWWWQVWSLRTLIRYRRMRVGASHAGRAGVRERRLAGVSSSDAHQSLLALFWGMGVWIEPVESYTIVNCPVLAIVDFAKKNEKRPKGAVIASGRSSRRALSVRSALMASDVGAPAAAPEGSVDAASAPSTKTRNCVGW